MGKDLLFTHSEILWLWDKMTKEQRAVLLKKVREGLNLKGDDDGKRPSVFGMQDVSQGDVAV